MSAHLLPLSALHAAGPGVLDVIFGADGDFPGAPIWRGPLVSCSDSVYFSRPFEDGVFVHCLYGTRMWRRLSDVALDCRIPSVAARLAGLCFRAARGSPHSDHDLASSVMQWITIGSWAAQDAAQLAALTLTLAPRIAALGGPYG